MYSLTKLKQGKLVWLSGRNAYILIHLKFNRKKIKPEHLWPGQLKKLKMTFFQGLCLADAKKILWICILICYSGELQFWIYMQRVGCPQDWMAVFSYCFNVVSMSCSCRLADISDSTIKDSGKTHMKTVHSSQLRDLLTHFAIHSN